MKKPADADFQREFSTSDLDILEELARAEARENFWAYRQYLNPDMKKGWWQRSVAMELQRFYEDLVEGRRPKLALEAPPQHGKSTQVIDFISWAAGKNPDLATIYTSVSDRLGVRANLRLQRVYDSSRYALVFPGTRIHSRNNSLDANAQYIRNRDLLEYVDHVGGFRNTTVNGPIVGEGLDLGVVDDPIKGRKAASSPTIRENTWEWFVDDFFTRFSEHAGMLLIATRWHLDDPTGRMIESEGGIRRVRYPALAEEDEEFRLKGEPLFPELKSREFLEERRKLMLSSSWETLYQQNPSTKGGGIFPVENFELLDSQPLARDITRTVRYWDKAGTLGGGDFSAGVLMHLLKDGRFVVGDVIRGQWSALEREKRIKETAILDKATWGNKTETWVEQEPGSGGKESAERTIINLAGHIVRADRVTGAKEVRAEPYAAQVEGGTVGLVAGIWVRAFKDEHETFPNGKYDDQVDAASGAFIKLANAKTYATGTHAVVGMY